MIKEDVEQHLKEQWEILKAWKICRNYWQKRKNLKKWTFEETGEVHSSFSLGLSLEEYDQGIQLFDGMKPTYHRCDHSWSGMFDKAKFPRIGFTQKSEIVQSDSTLKIPQSSIFREPYDMLPTKRHFYIKVLNMWFLKKTVCECTQDLISWL